MPWAALTADLPMFLVESKATHVCTTPSLWSLTGSLTPSQLPHLRTLVLGGTLLFPLYQPAPPNNQLTHLRTLVLGGYGVRFLDKRLLSRGANEIHDVAEVDVWPYVRTNSAPRSRTHSLARCNASRNGTCDP